ncbi:MAG: flippase-like domain-containing protein [Bernardetiaceae bacterium]|nr:flippase-like domain-containing protein [Bernardetiaceae bacterium]
MEKICIFASIYLGFLSILTPALMSFSIKKVLQYLLSLLVAIGIFYYLYGNEDMSEILLHVRESNYYCFFVSFACSIMSHWSRAVRWKIALSPLGYVASSFRMFLAVMVGYLANLVLPRAGEVARCAMLKRTDSIPINVSFGAVVTERVFDLIILILLVAGTIIIEFERIGRYLLSQMGLAQDRIYTLLYWLVPLGLLGMFVLFLLWRNREKFVDYPFYQKLVVFLAGLRSGFLSVFRLAPLQILFYVLHSFLIWIMYFMMIYVLFFLQPTTSDLSIAAGMAVLVMGGVGMALPVQGGIGPYHFFVAKALEAYDKTAEVAKEFAFIAHSSQVLMIIVLGGICLLIGMFVAKRRAKEAIIHS